MNIIISKPGNGGLKITCFPWLGHWPPPAPCDVDVQDVNGRHGQTAVSELAVSGKQAEETHTAADWLTETPTASTTPELQEAAWETQAHVSLAPVSRQSHYRWKSQASHAPIPLMYPAL